MTDTFHDPHTVYVGRDNGGAEHTVTPELIERYSVGTGDRHAWYHSPSPFGGPIAPAFLFHSEAYRDLGWYLPNLIGTLHARQEWELFYPMRVGERVLTRSTIVDFYRKRNRDYVVNEVLITNASGRWLQRSRTHQSFLADGDASKNTMVEKKTGESAQQVSEGDARPLTPIEKTITHEMCEAFSGPQRTYHTDLEMAQAMGFPDVVVQGMMSVCFLSELMTVNFGVGWFCGGRLDVKLTSILWPNDRLQLCGMVRDEVREGEKTRVNCDIWCEKSDGKKTVVGTASALK